MHRFLRAIGFSEIRKRDLESIIRQIAENPQVIKVAKDSEGNEFAEMSCDYAPNMGIKLCGTYEDDDHFELEYYYPYLQPTTLSTKEQIEVERKADRESYMGVSDELALGITLIFHVINTADYLTERKVNQSPLLHGARLSALSIEGKILLPIVKKKKANQPAAYKNAERAQLIAQAREGDEEAIENLTLEDMDMYSILSRRIMNEDILSIVASYFMPYGIESDQYSVLGDIIEYSLEENHLTKEKIYYMKVECNDIIFDVCINQRDLYGQPAVGRRFKGNVWMQGVVDL